MKIMKEFRDFAMKGNVIDMAVGIIIGAGFGKIVTSFVNDIIMPPIGMLVGKVNFSNLFLNLGPTKFATIAEAKAAGAPTLNYGMFLNTVIDFTIVAFVVFLIVKQANKMKPAPAPAPAPPAMQECPFCASSISIKASRCPQCTSELKLAGARV